MQGDIRETAYNYLVGDKTGTFFTAEQKWIRKVQRWQEQYPDEVRITHENHEDGKLDSILAELPIKWMKVSPPKKMNLTEEQLEQRRQRMKNIQANNSIKKSIENLK